MTQDEIIEMARQVGWSLDSYHGVLLTRHIPQNGIEAFAKLVAAKEREACALVCDEIATEDGWEGGYAYRCVEAIRARGEA